MKFGVPSDAMLWGAVPVLTHCQRTLPPTATVSTAAFTDLLRLLRKKLLPTVMTTVPGSSGGTGLPTSGVVEPQAMSRAARAPDTICFIARMTKPRVQGRGENLLSSRLRQYSRVWE